MLVGTYVQAVQLRCSDILLEFWLAAKRPERCLQPLTSVGPGCGSIVTLHAHTHTRLCWVGRFRRLLGLCWVGLAAFAVFFLDVFVDFVGLDFGVFFLDCPALAAFVVFFLDVFVGFAALAFVVFFVDLFVDFAVLAFVVFYLDLFVDFAALAFVVFYLDLFVDLLRWPSSSSPPSPPSTSSSWTLRGLRCVGLRRLLRGPLRGLRCVGLCRLLRGPLRGPAALAFVVFYLDCATFAAFVVFFLDLAP